MSAEGKFRRQGLHVIAVKLAAPRQIVGVPQSATSTNNVIFTAAKISSSIAPQISPRGVNLLPDARRVAVLAELVVLI
jgi:hypothetical protein